MLFIGYGKRGKPENGRGAHRVPRMQPAKVFGKFSASSEGKSLKRRISAAKRARSTFDRKMKGVHPSSREYQTKFREVFEEEYGSQIAYWRKCRAFAVKNNADQATLNIINNSIRALSRTLSKGKPFIK